MPHLYGYPPTHLMRHTVNFERSTVTQGTSGGAINTWAANITGAIALVQQLSADEVVRYGRENTRRMYNVIVAGSQDILQRDRVKWTSNSDAILQIVSVPTEGDGNTADITMTIVCEETVGQ